MGPQRLWAPWWHQELSLGWRRGETQVVELPRKRFKALERKENVYRSGNPVPRGKWVNWGAQRMPWERGGRGTGTLGYREGGDLGSAEAFGVRQAEMEGQERTPRARGVLGWWEVIPVGLGGQMLARKRGGVIVAEGSDKGRCILGRWRGRSTGDKQGGRGSTMEMGRGPGRGQEE